MRITFDEVEEDVLEQLDEYFGVKNSYIEVNPGNFLITPKYKEIADRILNLEVRPDDIWVVSYPRTGSNWIQEIVWCLANNLDYDAADQLSASRVSLLELAAFFGNDTERWAKVVGDPVQRVENSVSPRFIKTHLPWDLLPTQLSVVKPKMIYVARNPKDTSVSWYYCNKMLYGFRGTYDKFCKLFVEGKVPGGNVWKHAAEYWTRRDESNILFLKYEDCRKDIRRIIAQLSEFLGKSYQDEQIDGLVERTSFSNMRQNPSANADHFIQKVLTSTELAQLEETGNKFIRKGEVGGWRNYISSEMATRFDEQSKTNWTSIGLEFEDHI